MGMNIRQIYFTGFVLLTLISPDASSQSGRSWMNGIIFCPSETQGVAGAKVELIGDTASSRLRSIIFSMVTGEDGKYAFKDIPYGAYVFRVTARKFRRYQIPVYIASDALTALHVLLKPLRTKQKSD